MKVTFSKTRLEDGFVQVIDVRRGDEHLGSMFNFLGSSVWMCDRKLRETLATDLLVDSLEHMKKGVRKLMKDRT